MLMDYYHILAGFFSLVVLEIVLGIDNIVMIALTVEHLPKRARNKARTIGISLALFFRIGMLFGTAFLMSMTKPLITFQNLYISAKDIVMIGGGTFLLYTVTTGMHDEVTGEKNKECKNFDGNFTSTIIRIMIMDIVFSLDSILTAVGITNHIYVISAAMVIAMIFMLVSSGWVSNFIMENPTIKMLALSFVMMIGVFLIAQGFGVTIPKGYIYFSMAFSLVVEIMNMIRRKKVSQKKN